MSGLVLALRDKRSWVRESAVRTVEEIAPQLGTRERIEEIRSSVTPLLSDPEESVRVSATEVIQILDAYSRTGMRT